MCQSLSIFGSCPGSSRIHNGRETKWEAQCTGESAYNEHQRSISPRVDLWPLLVELAEKRAQLSHLHSLPSIDWSSTL